ncbi:hypothetical protein ACIRP2_31710 [Streptomyces sp. NPDC101194]|uniref:hypothetical protein n=1 Tax=Streptomyces sp. NPDC101194 TaxID=3366127 RepID=UPI00381306BC
MCSTRAASPERTADSHGERHELVAPARIGGDDNDRPRLAASDQDLVEVVGITLSPHEPTVLFS